MNTNLTVILLAIITGLITGAVFKLLNVPIPAPPEMPGIMGIIGIYLGYKIIEWMGVGYDLLDALGI